MELDWNDIHLVLTVCRAGSLSGAARELGVNYSTVFRRVNAIEGALNVRLFDRSSRGFLMTEAGEAVLRAAERMEEEATGLGRQLLGKDTMLRGNVRLTAPEGITLDVLMPALCEFGTRYPEIHQELVVSSDALNLTQREADIAVRATRSPPQTYVGRRVCEFRFSAYATKGYRRRHRDTPPQHRPWVLPDDGIDFFVPGIWDARARAEPNVVFTSRSAQTTLEAALRGLGAAVMPCFRGDAERKLVRLCEPPEELTLQLWVLTHPDLRRTARVQALAAMVYDTLLAKRDAFEGVGGKHARA